MTENTIGLLTIESDGDFEVIFKGETYYNFFPRSFCVTPAELPEFKFEGHPGKLYEVTEAMTAILKAPGEYFSNQGGNRGITWEPTADKIREHIYLTVQNRQKLDSIHTDHNTIINKLIEEYL